MDRKKSLNIPKMRLFGWNPSYPSDQDEHSPPPFALLLDAANIVVKED